MNNSLSPGIARIVILIGGTCAEMARYLKSLGADVVLWIDVFSELEKVDAAPGVVRLVLASGQTLASLFEGMPDDEHSRRLRRHLESLPGVDLNTGLAQSPFAGRRAAEQLVASPEFQAILRDIYSEILIRHNGTVEAVHVDMFSSGAGGTGGPGGKPIMDQIARHYRQRHKIVVHTRCHRAGAISFESLGPATNINNAATVFSDLSYTLLDDRPLEEVRSLNYFELPPARKDKAARDRFMATAVQALNCPAFRQVRDLIAPNNAGHSRLGSITLTDLGWYRGIGARRVRADVEGKHIAELKRALAAKPYEQLVDSLDVVTKALEPTPEASIPQLLQHLHSSKRREPVGFDNAVKGISFLADSVTCYVNEKGMGRVGFDAFWRTKCKKPCRLIADFSKRLAILRACYAAVDLEITSRTASIATLESEEQRAKDSVTEIKREYYPNSLAGRFLNLFADTQDRNRRLATSVQSYRELLLRRGRLESECEALRQHRDAVKVAIEEVESQLVAVVDLLNGIRSPASDTRAALVEVEGVDAVLEDLLQLTEYPEVDFTTVNNLLMGCAKRVTLAGLAEITGAHDARIDAVARKLNDAPATVGPHWGGKRPMTYDSTMFVLPPIAGHLQASLSEEFAPLVHHSDKIQLVFADTAEAGYNVLRMQIRYPKTFSEICTPQIVDEFETIAAAPERYFERGFDVDRIKQFMNGYAEEDILVCRPR